ncbi:hypothetical protein PA598K_00541 [Paenibacillus sp. 598K]|uniref:hypothetical protein n=1 Tax=Paenibacillus sp. 598K TaxID=1117987 RepID=UPI000FFA6CDA|nr:hypothetical protein [Paenibacillus sp. 598K]GBF72301.1 hypothetical protein PA598K_00541 [Paenibacillus sp. 598K]
MNTREKSSKRFRALLRRGLGEAILVLQAAEDRERYKEIVLWACLNLTIYDPQSEGSRGVYLMDAIRLFEDDDYFAAAMIRRFEQRYLDDWTFDQLCELLCLMAGEGSKRAAAALEGRYSDLLHQLRRRFSDTASTRLLWLSSWLTGFGDFRRFRRIVEDLGAYEHKYEGRLFLDSIYSAAQRRFGPKRVETYLARVAAQSAGAAAFLASIQAFRSEDSRSMEQDTPTLSALIASARAGKREPGLALRLARIATPDELRHLAQLAMEVTDPDVRLAMLWVFRKAPFPLGEELLIELAEHEDGRLSELAFEAMRLVPSDRIHAYAAELVRERRHLSAAIGLLSCCLRAGDEGLLEAGVRALSVTQRDNGWHSSFMRVEELLNSRKMRLDPSIYIHMYRQTLCSYCRHWLIKRMVRRRIIPHAMLEACLHDSYEDTRKLARRVLVRNQDHSPMHNAQQSVKIQK